MRTLRAVIKSQVKLLLRRGVRDSYSQFGEDAVMQWLLKGKQGTYVDIGAYHPTLYSNTYAFYKKGWQGIVVEPNPSAGPLFRALRPRDTFMNLAIGTQAGQLTYYQYADGAYNTLDAAQVERVKEERGISPLRTQELPVRSLTEVVRSSGLARIDLLSIDVEGMDLSVLESYDWAVSPKVICIEAHGFDPASPETHPVYQFLKSRGYALRGLAGPSLIFEYVRQ